MVETHRCTEVRDLFARQRRGPTVPARFLDQAGFIEQLITVEHAFLVPMLAAGAEIQPHAILAAQGACRVRLLALAGPAREFGKDVALDDGGPLLPPVFPRKEPVPGLERRARRA